MYALADCNSFYASCEKVFRPELKDRPVVVLSNNDGCVITRSPEAKMYVPMGKPYFQVKKWIKEHNIKVFSSNYALYGDMSRRVMQTFKRFVPAVEVYSIDEAFLDLTHLSEGLEDFAHILRQTVLQWTGIPTSIGVAPTKTLAKVANKEAKNTESGIYLLQDTDHIRELLTDYPIAKIWGIGRRLEKRLKTHRIKYVGDLLQKSDQWIKKEMTVVGLRMVKELRGEPCISMDLVPSPRKNILVSRTFPTAITDLDAIKEHIMLFTSRAAEKLRDQDSSALIVSVSLRTDRFKKNQAQYSESQIITLPQHSQYTPELCAYACKALEAIYRPGYIYRKAGVMLLGIIPTAHTQLSIFGDNSPSSQERKQKLMKAVDHLNHKLGKHTVYLGAIQEPSLQLTIQEKLSKRYTTRWDEILVVKQ